MNEAQMELLEEARESIEAAQLLLENDFPGYAASRAYYAMFYIAQAFLEGEGLAFSKHSAVISAFGKEFAKPGRVPSEFHKYLRNAMDVRYSGDYGPRHGVSHEDAQEQIHRAEQFLDLAEKLLAKQ